MADYDGIFWDGFTVSQRRLGGTFFHDGVPKMYYGYEFSPEASFNTGGVGLKLYRGGTYCVDYGCYAGSVVITAKAWAPINGRISMTLYDPDSGVVVGRDMTESTKVWEDLMIALVAEQKVYLLKFHNYPQTLQVEGDVQYGYVDEIT